MQTLLAIGMVMLICSFLAMLFFAKVAWNRFQSAKKPDFLQNHFDEEL